MPNPTDAELKALIDAAIPDSTPDESQILTAKTINDLLHQLVDGLGLRIPPGGTAGQVLVKASDDDFDVEWVDSGVSTPQLDAPSISVVAGDGKLTVTVGVVDGATDDLVQISTDDFATIANSASAANDGAPIEITATNGTAYKVRSKVSGAGYLDSDYAVASGTYTPTAGSSLFAYWVANDDGHVPDETEFQAGTAIPITAGQTAISFDITAQTTDRWVFFAEPVTEPEKTFKYASPLDNENLGNDGQINVGVDLTTLRYYPSNAPTSNTSFPIQLKVTA